MDGIGPVRPPDPKVFLNPPVWQRDRQQKPKPQPTSDDHDLEEEEVVEESVPVVVEDEHHLDLEA